MVEIAICLAIIGFALVAIIGVLPLGIQVQADNRQDSIINHDGAYFLDAIRKGAPADDLPLYVEQVTMWSNPPAGGSVIFHQGTNFNNGHEIIGLMSNPNVLKTEAIVRSLNGAASEKGDYTNEVAFKYKVTATIQPLESLNPDWMVISPQTSNTYWWNTNLACEVRLVFRYPLTFDGKAGAGRKVFRGIVSGRPNQDFSDNRRFFFYRTGLTNVSYTNIYAL